MQSKAVATLLRSSVIAMAISQLFSASSWAASDAERIAALEKELKVTREMLAFITTQFQELRTAQVAAKPTLDAVQSMWVRLAELEKPHTAASPDTAAQQTRIDTLERNVAQMAESSSRTSTGELGLPVHGFADVGYASSGKTVADGRKHGFALGNVDFYLTPSFGDRIKSLIELAFEYGADGSLATDLERLQVGYTFSDALTTWAGRFHTPYGYWNTAFHHGAQIQTSIMRPKMVAFEDQGGILPAHTVGMWATGQTRLAGGKVEYDAFVGNGARTVDGIVDFNALKDDNSNKIIGGNLRYKFSGKLDGLVLGTHGFSQKSSAYVGGAMTSTSNVNMLGAYGFYDGNDWEVISEYYRFRNSDALLGGPNHASWSGFLQVGKTIGGNVVPYVRFEKAVLDQTDNYFASLENGRSYSRQAVGLRYDLNPKAAIKFEMNRTDETRDGGEKYNEAQLQFAVRF